MFAGWGEEVLVSDRGDEGDDFYVVRETEVFFGDGAGCDAACSFVNNHVLFMKYISLGLTNRLTGTTTSTTTARLNPILLQISQVRMARPRVHVHRAPSVILRSLVLIAHHHPDRRAQGDSELRS